MDLPNVSAVTAKVKIDGEEMKNENLSGVHIRQKLFEPLLIEVDFQYSGQVQSEILSDINKYLGKKIEIVFFDYLENKDISGKYQGDITGIKANDNQIRLIGHSKDYVMTTGKKMVSYKNMNIDDMAKRVFNNNGLSGQLDSCPGDNSTFDYFQQYLETDYDFILRLACINGAMFFHDGEQFNYVYELGKNSYDSVPVEGFEIGCSLENHKVSAFLYNPENHKQPVNSMGKVEDNSDDLQTKTRSVSNTYFGDIKDQYIAGFLKQQGQSDLYAKVISRNKDSKRVRFTGKVHHPKIKIGDVIVPEDTIYNEEIVIIEMETYLDANQFDSSFIAVPKGLTVAPDIKEEEFYKTMVQPATVTNVKDTEAMGRVKVKYLWDDQQESFWCRIANSTAGKERGTHYIPQVNDQVLIAFEYGDPSKPIVIGSLYHSESKPYFNKNDGLDADTYAENLILKTPNGSVIRVWDKKSEEEIIIALKENGEKASGSVKLKMDGENNAVITIEAPDGIINFKSKDLNIETTGKINVKAKDAIDVQTEKTVDVKANDKITVKTAKDMSLEATGNIAGKATGKIELTATQDAKLAGLNVNVNANVGLTVKGNATAELSSPGQTTVKGLMVMIN